MANGLSVSTNSDNLSSCQAAALEGFKNNIFRTSIAIYLKQIRNSLIVQQSERVGGEALSMDFIGGRALKLSTT